MIYYISDLHIGDQRVFDLCLRPFSSLQEYENELIRRWNNKVTNDDVVFILGDIADCSLERVKEVFGCLNGRKRLIIGNHDEKLLLKYLAEGIVVSAAGVKHIEDAGRLVFLCHYPVMDWWFGDKKIYHVYGHVHNKTDHLHQAINDFYRDKTAYNASADVVNFEPVTLDELIRMKEEGTHEAYIN